MHARSIKTIYWILVAVALAACAPPILSQASAQPIPDSRTVSSTGGVELCRPGGRCFRPETNDPVFVGDEIRTYLPGRIELSVRGGNNQPIAFVTLTPNGGIRLDRGARVPTEIGLDRGLLLVEVISPPGMDVTFGDLGCRIERGFIAIGFNEVDSRRGAAYIANRDAECTCFTEARTTHPIARGTIAHFRRGRPADVELLNDSLWGSLREQR